MTRDWSKESVFVASPTRNDMQTNYGICMMRLLVHDLRTTGMVARGGGPLVTQATAMNLAHMRNTITTGFLDKTEADWLLWIDSDAGFAPEAVEFLVEAADPVDRPVMGALAFMVRKHDTDDMGGFRWSFAPTIYGWFPDESGKHGFVPRYRYPANTVVRASATGCHMLLVHRSALEKLRAEHGDNWFTRFVLPTHEDLGLLGEDFSFCVRLAYAQIPLHVHTGVKTTHQQVVWVGEEDYQDQLLLSQIREAAQKEAGEAAAKQGSAPRPRRKPRRKS